MTNNENNTVYSSFEYWRLPLVEIKDENYDKRITSLNKVDSLPELSLDSSIYYEAKTNLYSLDDDYNNLYSLGQISFTNECYTSLTSLQNKNQTTPSENVITSTRFLSNTPSSNNKTRTIGINTDDSLIYNDIILEPTNDSPLIARNKNWITTRRSRQSDTTRSFIEQTSPNAIKGQKALSGPMNRASPASGDYEQTQKERYCSCNKAKSMETPKLSIWPPTNEEKPLDLKIFDLNNQSVVNGLRKEHKELFENLKKQHELEIFNIRGECAIKITDLEDKIQKLNNELEALKTTLANKTPKSTQDSNKTQKILSALRTSNLSSEVFGEQKIQEMTSDVKKITKNENTETKPSSLPIVPNPPPLPLPPSLPELKPVQLPPPPPPPIPIDLFATQLKPVSSAPPPPPPPIPIDLFSTQLKPVSSAPPPPPPITQELFNNRLIQNLNNLSTSKSNESQLIIPPPPPPICPDIFNKPHDSIPPPPPPMSSDLFQSQSSHKVTPPPPPPISEDLFKKQIQSSIPPAPPFLSISGPPLPMTNGIPPPPPPPPLFSVNSGPPPPPPPFNVLGNGPPPPPPPGGMFYAAQSIPQRIITRKKYTPKTEMKTLYWNRLQMFQKSNAIWFDIKEVEIDEDFENLFAKPPTKKVTRNTTTQKTNQSKEVIKLLDGKRSQAIGILMSSQRLDSQTIKDALIGFNSSILNHETLNSIYSIRPQEDEIKMLNDFLNNGQCEENLDKPELFLLELNRIPAFEERIYCLVYQTKFNENLSSIEFRLNNLKTLCDELVQSEKIKKILGIILSCGNNMNASNKSRGDADGFDIAILPSLKDVKSKDNTTNLLNYVAMYFLHKIDDSPKFPIPEPSDLVFTANITFNDFDNDFRKFEIELNDLQKRRDNVLAISPEDTHEPFKTNINKFIKEAQDELKEQQENYELCKTKFIKTVAVFCVKPKPGESDVTPNYFFMLWANFSNDFKEAWKRESQKLAKQKLKEFNETRNKLKSQQQVKKTEKTGLKALFSQDRRRSHV